MSDANVQTHTTKFELQDRRKQERERAVEGQTLMVTGQWGQEEQEQSLFFWGGWWCDTYFHVNLTRMSFLRKCDNRDNKIMANKIPCSYALFGTLGFELMFGESEPGSEFPPALPPPPPPPPP